MQKYFSLRKANVRRKFRKKSTTKRTKWLKWKSWWKLKLDKLGFRGFLRWLRRRGLCFRIGCREYKSDRRATNVPHEPVDWHKTRRKDAAVILDKQPEWNYEPPPLAFLKWIANMKRTSLYNHHQDINSFSIFYSRVLGE